MPLKIRNLGNNFQNTVNVAEKKVDTIKESKARAEVSKIVADQNKENVDPDEQAKNSSTSRGADHQGFFKVTFRNRGIVKTEKKMVEMKVSDSTQDFVRVDCVIETTRKCRRLTLAEMGEHVRREHCLDLRTEYERIYGAVRGVAHLGEDAVHHLCHVPSCAALLLWDHTELAAHLKRANHDIQSSQYIKQYCNNLKGQVRIQTVEQSVDVENKCAQLLPKNKSRMKTNIKLLSDPEEEPSAKIETSESTKPDLTIKPEDNTVKPEILVVKPDLFGETEFTKSCDELLAEMRDLIDID